MLSKLRGKSRPALVLLLCGGLVVSLFVASTFGAVSISFVDIWKMVLNKLPVFDFALT